MMRYAQSSVKKMIIINQAWPSYQQVALSDRLIYRWCQL